MRQIIYLILSIPLWFLCIFGVGMACGSLAFFMGSLAIFISWMAIDATQEDNKWMTKTSLGVILTIIILLVVKINSISSLDPNDEHLQTEKRLGITR